MSENAITIDPELAERERVALERMRAADGTPEIGEARMAWWEIYQEIEGLREAAINAAIDEGAEDATRWGAEPITALERAAVSSLADRAVDLFRGQDHDCQEQARVGASLAHSYAEDELLRKVLAAWYLEYTVADAGIADGIVGRAVDAAIAQLRPYEREKVANGDLRETL